MSFNDSWPAFYVVLGTRFSLQTEAQLNSKQFLHPIKVKLMMLQNTYVPAKKWKLHFALQK